MLPTSESPNEFLLICASSEIQVTFLSGKFGREITQNVCRRGIELTELTNAFRWPNAGYGSLLSYVGSYGPGPALVDPATPSLVPSVASLLFKKKRWKEFIFIPHNYYN